jgi:competence protein ComEC
MAPLVPLVIAAAIGIALDRSFEPFPTLVWYPIATACGITAFLTLRHASLSTLAITLAAGAIAGGSHHARWFDLADDDLAATIGETPTPAWVRGVTLECLGIRKSEGYGYGSPERITTRFVIEITAVNDRECWRDASGRVLVVVGGDCRQIGAGRAVEAAGQLARIAGPLNPGEFDYRNYLQAQGLRLRMSVDEPGAFWLDPNGSGNALLAWLGDLKDWSHARLVDRLDPSVAPLAAALLLGRRDEVEPEVNDAFSRTGTTHLLAISGLQLQALAGALLVLFRVAGMPRRAAYLVVAVMMAGYALLVGLAPSVVRSTLMTAAFCLAAISHRLAPPANTLALAALGTLAINPSFLFDVGCQLSFLAIGAIVWLVPPACKLAREFLELVRNRIFGPPSPLDELERRLEPWYGGLPRKAAVGVLDGVIGSTVVWLAALPLVACRFHIVSAIGILLNIPLIPLTSMAMLGSALGLILSTIWAPLGTFPSWAAGELLRLTESIVFWGVRQPWGHRFVAGPTWGWVLVFYVLLLVAGISTRVRPTESRLGWFARVTPWLILSLWFVPGWIATAPRDVRTPAIEVLAVGHGLAILIETAPGHFDLYDCGAMGDRTVGRRIIAQALWARGANRIDTVILSHADQDHYGALPELLDRFHVGMVRIPQGFAGERNPGTVELIDDVKRRGILVQPTSAPETWQSGRLRFTVEHPPADWHPETSDNARSLVIDLERDGRHALLTGDLEFQGLEAFGKRPFPEPPPDVFLSPHHGGKAANPLWLYEWAIPRIVVVSQRPPASASSDALAGLEAQGITLYRTWLHGAVRFEWTDDGIEARGFLEESKHNATTGSSPTMYPFWNTLISAVNVPGLTHYLAGAIGFVVGGFACLMLAVVEFAAWFLVVPPRRRDSDADPASKTEPIFAIAADGSRLAGRWYPASHDRPTGRTVLLLHGFAEHASALEPARVATLNRHGWNVAALDSRGYGQSDGPYASFGGRESHDLVTWLDMLADRLSRTDPALRFQPTLWGRSMGAAIAMRGAALDARIIALVLESPMVDLTESLAGTLRRRRIPFPTLCAKLVLRRAGKLAGMPLERPRPTEVARQMTRPTLIVHGTDDYLVSIEDASRLAEAFPSRPRWLDVPGAGHTDVIDKGGEPLFEQIAQFLDEAAQLDQPLLTASPNRAGTGTG